MLIPDEKMVAIPEPQVPHVVGPPLFLREEELIHAHLPALRYLVRLRVVEYHDWGTPPPSSDDEFDDGDEPTTATTLAGGRAWTVEGGRHRRRGRCGSPAIAAGQPSAVVRAPPSHPGNRSLRLRWGPYNAPSRPLSLLHLTDSVSHALPSRARLLGSR